MNVLSALLMQSLADSLADFWNQQRLFEESPAVCCFGPPCLLKYADRLVKSTALNRL
jgi:hypothetical protein